LDELAAALNDDASFSTTVTNSIAAKLPLAGGTLTGALTISGDLTVDTSTLKVDSSNNRVGIGTSSPSTVLDVQTGGDNLFSTTGVVSGGVTAITMKQSRGSLASPSGSSTDGDGNYILSKIHRGGSYQTAAWVGMTTDSGADDGRIVFGTAKAGTVSEKVRINEDGNVGIGTTNPGTRLHIQSPDNTLATDIFKFTSQNAAAGLKFGYQRIEQIGATVPITFNTGGSEAMRIDSSGNVNIGAKDYHTHNSTVDSLQIGYAFNLYEDSYSSGTDNYAVWANNAYYAASGGNKYMRNDQASRLIQDNGNLAFQNAAAGTADNAITFVDRLKIDSSGNVGIGDPNPSEKFVVKGDGARMIVSSADMEVAMLGRRGSSGAALDSGYLRLRKEGSTANGVVIDTNGNSHFNGGNVGIGESSPAYPLHVNSSTNVPAVIDSSDTTTYLYIRNSNAATGRKTYLAFAPANNIHGAAIYAEAMEDFSTSANRTADLAFETRHNGTIVERLRITSSGLLKFPGGSAVDNANTNFNINLPATGGITMGSAYTFANIHGDSGGSVYIKANAYPANTGSATFIKLRTANASGGTDSDVTVSGGNIAFASGKGIDFSATAGPSNSASSSSELFDDYEQGSWTPVLSGVGSHTLYYARYTKIGDLCYLSCYVYNLGSITGGSGDFAITGLPYTGTHANGAAGVTNCAHSTNTKSISSRIHNNAVYIVEDITSNGGNWVNCNQLQYASHVQITIVYHV